MERDPLARVASDSASSGALTVVSSGLGVLVLVGPPVGTALIVACLGGSAVAVGFSSPERPRTDLTRKKAVRCL
jgi:hypothetical protein